MKHFKIIIGEKEFDLSSDTVYENPNGHVCFYRKNEEEPLFVAKNFDCVYEITEQVQLENLTKELLDSIMEYYNEADHRIFNDLPIFDKEEVRKEAVKISVLYDKIQEIQKRIKT